MDNQNLPQVYYIGIGGYARAGKDFFYDLFCNIANKDFDVFRFALADVLKDEMHHFIKQKYGIDTLNLLPEEKEFIRPLWVEAAKKNREKTNGRYYIDKLESKINDFLDQRAKLNAPSKPVIIFITDIRHNKYVRDEVYWLRKEKKGVLIHLIRFFANNKRNKPGHKEELANDILVRKQADFNVIWKDYEGRKGATDKVIKFLDFFNNKVNNSACRRT